MSIYDKINKIANEEGSYDEKMYRVLLSNTYSKGGYQRQSLGEGMEVINQVIWGWYKPRFLVNHNLHTAYEWMWANEQLAIVDSEHIDWDSMAKLPEEALSTLQAYSFKFPSFLSFSLKNRRSQLSPGP